MATSSAQLFCRANVGGNPSAATVQPKAIEKRPLYVLRGVNHYRAMKATTTTATASGKPATQTAKQMNRAAAKAAHVVAEQITASKERETKPSRPTDGRSSKAELYEYHKKRGTLDEYYRMFPELKNG